MLTSYFILFSSFGMVLYWARTAVVSLLDGPRAVSEALRIAEANRLEFPLVRQALASAIHASEYPRLADALRHDFAAMTYLLRFAATPNVGRYSSQERLLVMDFHLMRMIYFTGKSLSPRVAQFALGEMTSILEHFADVMSKRMSGLSLSVMQA